MKIKSLVVRLEEEILHVFKMKCVAEKVTMSDMIRDMILKFMKKNK